MIVNVRSYHNKEFGNAKFSEFYAYGNISLEPSVSITSWQGGLVEQKTRVIQESTRVMIHDKQLPLEFWAEAMSTDCYIYNRVTLREGTSTTL